MLKKKLLIALSLLLSLTVSGCATIDAKDIDVPVCFEADIDKGRCTHTVSDKDMVIDEKNKYMGKTWWELKTTMVYVPYPSWVNLKTFVIKVCKKKLVNCEESISSWDRKFDYIENGLKEKFRR